MALLNQVYTLHATCSRGLEQLLAEELLALGFTQARPRVGRVLGEATLAQAYRALIWSRLANRLHLQLDEAAVNDAQDLNIWLSGLDWSEHLLANGSLLIDASGTTPQLRNTHDTALRVKDAITDWFREREGERPSVDRDRPDVRLHLRLEKGKAQLSLDLGGGSLHQRGYRLQAAKAPLKENLAAGLLYRAGWPELARQGYALLDPFCGSGTLLAEAAFIARDIAPGLLRPWHGVETWLGHRPSIWQELLDEAQERKEAAAGVALQLEGSDMDPRALQAAKGNLERAGLLEEITLVQRPIQDLPPAMAEKGLVITNPPYGERLEDIPSLLPIYTELGQKLLQGYPGWRLALFTQHKELAFRVPLKPYKTYPLQNASLECQLYLFELPLAGAEDQQVAQIQRKQQERAEQPEKPKELTEGGQMFANRLKKNLKKLSRWVKREGVEAYRVYDADLPEYALAIDLYGDRVHVQEYAPPASIDPDKANQRLADALAALPQVLEVPAERIHLKQRRRQTGKQQYEKLAGQGDYFPVREGQAQLLVNLSDYLDTGLFLDHRPIRLRLFREARGKRFLNLFCYTGAATVQAALGGAIRSTSVDLSKTYLGWLEHNLQLNQLNPRHHTVVQADCRDWLKQDKGSYDLIFMDPPTFSNSKRMQGTLDIQRDQNELVNLAMQRLSSDGLLIFSNNLRGFKISEELQARYEVKDISRQTLDPDFERNPRIHQCFEIRNPVL
ncbi:bifunctional 23S rRNA (guanine(2069)-N(7))-methyltransferase RlmK/23S rRNA (guanine(2445)-N(2))-methyltransferase RlmL [Marinospirillum sp.]|uniref:bifunctional 23S rRNA (guanine(2069)-N(7))-methyltransferase RlmK/23S rRNA (guanine(2445)-N(2))-methyltransferase RlmL n=1 Tax=Marinospirillum sp. TaxID=2183934 RepID=UPI00286FC0D7|nr:bifunctional 23S rRNA (guanine(2069)-N(7))-methyltransferase RlmK/23S rRNA (guanine(2445)-N(2))-methyltransferase RlmL [Marinospirillum sp.]MDR9468335.1 bifunctional 23S rRNA (guanine(2069)-N(7))-methyltransferase RlmK/23S rRNA (guanine(2445)-N(2))-methyltransferase RlmL [Marinospirillum sp.]